MRFPHLPRLVLCAMATALVGLLLVAQLASASPPTLIKRGISPGTYLRSDYKDLTEETLQRDPPGEPEAVLAGVTRALDAGKVPEEIEHPFREGCIVKSVEFVRQVKRPEALPRWCFGGGKFAYELDKDGSFDTTDGFIPGPKLPAFRDDRRYTSKGRTRAEGVLQGEFDESQGFEKYGFGGDIPAHHPARIFPGEVEPDELNKKKLRRDVVRILAEVELGHEREPVQVLFRAFDLDDPSADRRPVDDPGLNAVSPSIMPNQDLAERDNRGATDSPQGPSKEGTLCDPEERNDVAPGNKGIYVDVKGQKAVALFQITLPPGDNFKLGAVCVRKGNVEDEKPLRESRNVDKNRDGLLLYRYAGGSDEASKRQDPWDNEDHDPVKVSRTLTVWRKMHIEFDKMETEIDFPRNCAVYFKVDAVSASGPSFDKEDFRGPHKDAWDFKFGGLERVTGGNGRFERGKLRVREGNAPAVTIYEGNIKSNTVSALVIDAAGDIGTLADIAAAAPEDIYGCIYDDDVPVLPEDLGDPQFDLMQDSDRLEENRFVTSYIRPNYGFAKKEKLNGTVGLWHNLKTTPVLDYDRDGTRLRSLAMDARRSRSLPSKKRFWSLYFLKAFQPDREFDADPDKDLKFAAITRPLVGRVDEKPVSGMFYELNREATLVSISRLQALVADSNTPSDIRARAQDALLLLKAGSQDLERYTVLHEGAHQFSVDGTTANDVDHRDFGLMDTFPTLILTDHFWATSIHKMRKIEAPSKTK